MSEESVRAAVVLFVIIHVIRLNIVTNQCFVPWSVCACVSVCSHREHFSDNFFFFRFFSIFLLLVFRVFGFNASLINWI